MSDDKRELILEFIEAVEEGISDLSGELEFNMDIKDEDWDQYDIDIAAINNTLRLLKDEI